MRLRRPFVGIALVASLLLTTIPRPSPLVACAPAPREGESVRISGEAALIVWDPKSKTEHFVRRAYFETSAHDFGFLVPTPTPPDLGEVDDGLFDSLSAITRARHVTQKVIKTVFGFGLLPESQMEDRNPPPTTAAMPPGAAVEVLHEQTVAGFDATVLKADDPKALAEWLGQHGYESRPALTEWLQWYTDHTWIITAFKLTKDGEERDHLGTKSVRMSFHADRPFYPYREPADMRQSAQGARVLRLFFLADQRYEGTLGDQGKWPGSTVWADDVSGKVQDLTTPLKLTDALAKSLEGVRYLTEFQDNSNPRPGTDEVYFRPASDQSSRERPPIVHVDVEVRLWPGPQGGIAIVVLPVMIGAGILTYRNRRRLAKSGGKADLSNEI
jgi:Uncharacterized protein conserved in bacteria (DUF2330)